MVPAEPSLETQWEQPSDLSKANPMLGLRGCRLGLEFPEIYAMQVRAIVRAASKVGAKGTDVRPEIMIPLVCHDREMAALRARLEETILGCFEETGAEIEYKIGAMIQLPRAALIANDCRPSAIMGLR